MMKHLKARILLIILSSALLIFAVSFVIINVFVPKHFESEAKSALLYELNYLKRVYNQTEYRESVFIDYPTEASAGSSEEWGPILAGTYEYDGSFLSGIINSFNTGSDNMIPAASEAKKEFNYSLNHSIATAEHRILEYCEKNNVELETCYTLKTEDGCYVFLRYKDFMPWEDDPGTSILFIDIRPMIQYTSTLNWILLVSLVVVAAVMSVLGLRLGENVEHSQQVQRQFFQNASHELKTPLMSIQGYAEGIQTGVLPPKDSANVILEESDKMTSLVEELLAVSKLDSHQAKLRTDVLDVREILDDCLISVDPTAAKRGISVEILFPQEPVRVTGDAVQLRRAFLNIITNGLRHAGSLIRVRCESDKKNVIVTIADDGGGVAPEDIAHIFDRFYTGKNGNTGIGLALTREIVTLHKGTVSAYNDEKGAVFEVRLPLA